MKSIIEKYNEFKIEVRIRYNETDMSKMAEHSNYFKWMIWARVELLRELGYSYKKMEEDGIFFPVAEASCKFLQPLFMDDIVEIYPRIASANRRLIKFEYLLKIKGKDGKKIATAKTTHLSINADGKSVSLPEKYLGMLNKIQNI